MSNLLADLNETVALLGGTVIFDVAEVAAQCNENCQIIWCEDSEAYIIRSSNGTPLFLLDVSLGCIDAVKQ